MDALHDLKAINRPYDSAEEKIDICLGKCIIIRVAYMDISLLFIIDDQK